MCNVMRIDVTCSQQSASSERFHVVLYDYMVATTVLIDTAAQCCEPSCSCTCSLCDRYGPAFSKQVGFLRSRLRAAVQLSVRSGDEGSGEQAGLGFRTFDATSSVTSSCLAAVQLSLARVSLEGQAEASREEHKHRLLRCRGRPFISSISK
jgi:hypothetical protein